VTVANDFNALDENLSCVKKKDAFVLLLHNETLTGTDVFLL
jgi:phosphoserine aminotransferase